MTTEWTKEQEQAITLRDTNILVSAGAGSGKTAVLVERVVSLITDAEKPVDIDRILVVTFTKAAAEEMRSRLHDRLSEILRTDPDNHRLQRQLALLPSASVTTLHSFCFDIVRHYFNVVGLDAGFRIAKDYELYLLQQETLEAYIEKQYEEKNPYIKALADAYGGSRDDSGLLTAVLKVYDFVIAQPDPIAWLTKQIKSLDNAQGLDDIPSCAYLKKFCQDEVVQAGQLLRKSLDFAEHNGLELSDHINAEIVLCDELAEKFDESFDEFLQALQDYQFIDWRRAKVTKESEYIKDQMRLIYDEAKIKIKNLQAMFPVADSELIFKDVMEQHELVKALCELTKGFIIAFREAKREKGIVDFSDMEHYCLAILKKAAKDGDASITQRFDEVLVDEYQDINNVQETIISEMSQNGNCFMVGDVKQAIYHFRLADTDLFIKKHKSYKSGKKGVRIDLNCNYRSVQCVLDSVNEIFSKLMTTHLCSIDYSDGAALVCGRKLKGEPSELLVVDKGSLAEEFEDDEAHAARMEARVIGKRIKELLAEGHQLKDIVILLRSYKSWSAAMIDELTSMGIAAIGEGQSGYLDSSEIRQMMSLLQVIDNPLQDIEMAAVMRGVFGGFTADEILQVRNAHKYTSLYDALCVEAKNGMLKAEILVRKLQNWHEKSANERLSVFIRGIYNETGFYHMVGALTMGEQRQMNLNSLYDRAREFETQQGKGLFRFIRFIKDLEERNHPLNVTRPLIAQEQAVRLMTIHHSKGLQFPVVFVAGLGKNFIRKDSSGDILLHKDLGICSKGINRRKRITYPTMAWQAMSQKIKSESIAEELRILYVALTRAREKLILVGSFNNAEKALAALHNKGYGKGTVPHYLSSAANNFLQWICRVLYAHPNASALRTTAGYEDFCEESDTSWKISVVKSLDITSETSETAKMSETQEAAETVNTEENNNENDDACPQEQKDYIKHLLNWEYAYSDIMNTPVKWTVTELQKMSYEKTHEHYSGCIFGERTISAADLGTAYHKVLENIDFGSKQDMPALIAEMNAAGKLSDEEISNMDMQVFDNFLNSELGTRLAKAKLIEKEKAFTLAVPAHYIINESNSSETLILQGKIDLFFYDEEADGYVIVDYKSGNRGASDEDLQKRYGKQLALYEHAVSSVYGKKIVGNYIYLLNDARIAKMK